jgi:formylmethanofuran dehydrogenase subunit B
MLNCPHCGKGISDEIITAHSGRIGGKKTAKRGSAYFKKIAAMRKTRAGGRPKKES